MGRKSVADKIYEKAKEEYEEERGMWFVMYDFKGKASGKFWDNLNRVKCMGDGGSLIQHSVFATTSAISAITVARLVKHYGGNVIMHNAAEPIWTMGEDGLLVELGPGMPGKFIPDETKAILKSALADLNKNILRRKGYEID